MSERQPADPSREYINDLLRTDIDDRDNPLPNSVNDLLANDYPLANLTSADRKFFRLMAENIKIFAKERYPAQNSYQQGVLGAALLDDPTFEREAMSDVSSVKIESALMDHFARTSRGVRGWQQDKFSESIQTNRVEDNRGDGTEQSGSLLDRIS
jgi:hypothetical protein